MECPNCGKANAEGSRFCIVCGTPLPAPTAGRPSVAPQDPPRALAQQVQALQGEVRRLRGDLVPIYARLVALEQIQGSAAPPPQPSPAPRAAARPRAQPATSAAGETPAIAPTPPSPPGAGPARSAGEWDWEQIVGGNWLVRVGVLAIIIGVVFFLKLAFDNNWIGPTGRVLLGLVAGLVMLGGGEYLQRRYPIYGHALSGGGIALLYVSTFAAFGLYHLIALTPASGFLLLISVASAALALRHESMALAIIVILGAFSGLFILGFTPAAPGAAPLDRSLQLLVYLVVVDLGVVALSTFRNWRWFTLLALVGSLAGYGAWYDQYGESADLVMSEGSITLIFVIFVGATSLFHILWRRAPQAFDYSLMVINAAAYFGISYGLLWSDYRAWLGGFSLLLALFYGGLAYLALQRSSENARLSLFALGIALVFLTVAIPVQLGDQAWTTVAWAAQGALLVWLSFVLRLPQLRLFSYAVFAIVAVRLLFFDTTVALRPFQPVLNERFLAFAAGITAMSLAAFLLRREREALREWEQTSWFISRVFWLSANFFSLWLLSAEVLDYLHPQINAQNLSLTALWSGYAAIFLIVGIVRRSRPVRLAALGLLAFSVLKVFGYDVFTLERVFRISALIGLGVILLAAGYLYQRYGRTIREVLLAD